MVNATRQHFENVYRKKMKLSKRIISLNFHLKYSKSTFSYNILQAAFHCHIYHLHGVCNYIVWENCLKKKWENKIKCWIVVSWYSNGGNRPLRKSPILCDARSLRKRSSNATYFTEALGLNMSVCTPLNALDHVKMGSFSNFS